MGLSRRSRDSSLSLSVTEWGAWLAGGPDLDHENRIRARTYTGGPCGDDAFVKIVEGVVGRRLAPAKPGPNPRLKSDGEQMLLTEDEIRR